MYVKILLFIVLISSVNSDPRRVPKIYNAVITSSDNLEPSKAYPIIQPVIQPAAIAYQVHLPYIPNGAYPNYLQQHIHPDINTYSFNTRPELSHNIGQTYQSNIGANVPSPLPNIRNVPERGNILQDESTKVAQDLTSSPVSSNLQSEASINVQSPYAPNLEQPQYQQIAQPNVIEAKAILPSRSNTPPVQISPNYPVPQQNPSLRASPQQVQSAPSVTYQNVNQPSSTDAVAGMPQYGDILNNHFRHKYPDIPDVPPPPLPTTRRKMGEVQTPNVQHPSQ